MGAISALGGGGDLGMLPVDAEVGGDVVILRSVSDMMTLRIDSALGDICLSQYLYSRTR
jgi:hypothetical protein